jgi:hypothetical protein
LGRPRLVSCSLHPVSRWGDQLSSSHPRCREVVGLRSLKRRELLVRIELLLPEQRDSPVKSAASVSRVEWSKPRVARRSATASHVNRPCLQFPFRSPLGAPLPAAPPCIRQRLLPATLGARHGAPARVRAPHWSRRSRLGRMWGRSFRVGASELVLEEGPGISQTFRPERQFWGVLRHVPCDRIWPEAIPRGFRLARRFDGRLSCQVRLL